jgi:hypothetical protein
MLNIDMNKVTDFFNHYHKKSISSPNLYVAHGNDAVNVILPNNLLEFANAAAGHSGFGSGARARGIRRSYVNAKSEIETIFSTVNTLADFLLSSECNAEEYVETVRMRHLGMKSTKKSKLYVVTDDRPADKNFAVLYEKHDIKTIVKRFGRETCLQARKTLTINEFELRFGLVA